MAACHRVADEHLVVAVGKGGVALRRLACAYGSIHRGVQRAKGVGESLGVATGKARGATPLFVEDRGVAQQELVGAPAMPDPELVGPSTSNSSEFLRPALI